MHFRNSVVLRIVFLAVLVGLLSMVPNSVIGQGKKKGKETEQATSATFEIYKDKGGKYRFRLKEKEGKLLANSGKGYKENDDVKKVVSTIQKTAAKSKVTEDDKTKVKAAHFQIYKDKGGKYRFRFKDEEDVLLAASVTGYKTKGDVQKIIDTIQQVAGKAKIEAAKKQ